MPVLIPVLGFFFVTLLVVAAVMAFSPSSSAIERRLGEVAADGGVAVATDPGYDRMITDTLTRIGNFVPKSPSEMGKLQQRLVMAGYRRNEAVPIFFGIRMAIALALFVLLSMPIIIRPNLILALGGSATNDGACGAAAALGTKFFDAEGKAFVPTGGTLSRIAKIDNSETKRLLSGVAVTAMCDIDNPMHGSNGAAAAG